MKAIFAFVIVGTLCANCFGNQKEKVRVACIGDSITVGEGLETPYPEKIQELLGDGFEVRNFGVNAATLLLQGAKPYAKQPEFVASIQFQPHVVFILLGTNDSKADDWAHAGNFIPDYETLASQYLRDGENVVIFACTPAVVENGAWGIDEALIQRDVAPMVRKASKQLNIGLVDVNAAFKGKKGLWSDGVHLNQAGADLVAKTMHLEVERLIKKPAKKPARKKK